MSGIHKKRPLKLQGERRSPRIAAGVKKLESDGLPWVEYEEMPEGWEGDVVSIDQIAGMLVIFNEIEQRQSRFDEGVYLLVRIQVGDEEFILRTGSKPVVGAILHMAHLDKIPFRAFVEHRKGKWPGGYYCLSGPATADEAT